MAITNFGNGTGLIQAQGIGSGLDIQSLVRQLVAAEAAPTETRLTRHAAVVGTQVSALGILKGALSGFQSVLAPLKDTSLFQVLTATSADDDVFIASADSNAVAGSYDIEVSQLAKSEQLVSGNFAGGAGAIIGTGTLTLTVGTKVMTLTITGANNTLGNIRDAINGASNNPGVEATLINTTAGANLVLTSRDTGAANTIRLSSTGAAGLEQLDHDGSVSPRWTTRQTAQDAMVAISGIARSSASNTITGAIDGVTLTLKSAAPGTPNTLSIASDQAAVVANVRKFVDGYNAMRGKFDSLSFYNAAAQTAGPLLADPMLNGIDSQMRRLSLGQVSGLAGDYTSLAAIGVTSDAKGKLALNDSKLKAALTADRSAVARLFGASGGIAVRLDAALTDQLASTGTIAARDKSLVNDQKTIDEQRVRHNARMTTIQQRYLTQFNALDTLLSEMRRTSTFLTQQLGAASTTG
jgi:flagellar hook-associated protein 2